MPSDPLEAVIRPIVEGQVRSFIADHPNILTGVDWYKPRPGEQGRAQTLTGSISKRILRDLLCSETRVRLEAAIRARACADAD